MTRRLLVPAAGLAALIALGWSGLSSSSSPSAPVDLVQASYRAQIDTLVERIDGTVGAVRSDPGDGTASRAAFERARLSYKRIEHLAEQYYPGASEGINGAPIDEIEDDDGAMIRAQGFQVVEPLLYPALTADTALLLGQLGSLRASAVALRMYADATELSDSNVFESMRRELVRVFALGLSGFDSSVALRSMPEAAAALSGMRATLSFYAGARVPAELAARIDARLASAAAILDHADFDTLDRLAFLREQLIPLHRLLDEARVAARVEPPVGPTAWRTDVASPYDADAFDLSFFSPTPGTSASPEVAVLGAELFASPLLSGDGSRSCATCHRPDAAFAEGEARHAALGGGRLERNTPGLLNAGLARGNFHDLRTTWLEDQAGAVLSSPEEMGSSADQAAARLRQKGDWTDRFRAAGLSVDSIVGGDVQIALAAYVRSLVALDSRFDRYVRGDDDAMTVAERHGFDVFMGKGKCGTCHFAPLFSGAVPPTWEKTEVEVLGVPAHPDTVNATVDPDEGRFRIDRSRLHRYAFRTPTVRNVAVTAPYMHNGAYATLEQVVDFYDRGGGAGIGIALDNQTLPPDPLDLTAGEKRDLVAFLKALTDTVPVVARPVTAR